MASIKWRLLLAAPLLLLPIAFCSCERASYGRTETTKTSIGLVQDLRQAFSSRNAGIQKVWILEVRPNPEPTMEPGDEYLILATGRAMSSGDSVRLADELYGVFAADSSLTHMTREIDIFPTKRWGDYSVRFDWSSDGRLDVVGSGESYGDQGVRHIYNWSPLAGSKARVREIPTPRDTSVEGSD